MKTDRIGSHRAALEILFPAVRARVLRLLFDAPQKRRYVRELMTMSGLALHTIQDELRKLSAIDLVVSWSNGYQRFYRANRNHALFDPILQIVELSSKLPNTHQSSLVRPAGKRRTKKRP